MTGTPPAELQRLLAAEFDRQGWEYDLEVGRQLVAGIEQRGGVDGAALAQALPSSFFARSGTTREAVAKALERVVGGRTVATEARPTVITIVDKRYQVNLAAGSRIDNSQLNVGGGTQLNVQVDAKKDTVLTAIGVLLRAGLTGSWDADAAADLAAVIDSRQDIDVEDVREITTTVVKAEQPRRGPAKDLLTTIAASGLGGALATGISAGMGEVIAQLPL